MLVINETNILLAVIGSVGVLASLITVMYSFNRNAKYEKRQAVAYRAAVAKLNDAENTEVVTE